jgi:hypothetical protein
MGVSRIRDFSGGFTLEFRRSRDRQQTKYYSQPIPKSHDLRRFRGTRGRNVDTVAIYGQGRFVTLPVLFFNTLDISF